MTQSGKLRRLRYRFRNRPVKIVQQYCDRVRRDLRVTGPKQPWAYREYLIMTTAKDLRAGQQSYPPKTDDDKKEKKDKEW